LLFFSDLVRVKGVVASVIVVFRDGDGDSDGDGNGEGSFDSSCTKLDFP
jgi:hypothetical protein